MLPVPEVREQVLRDLQLPEMVGTRLAQAVDGAVHGADAKDRREDEERFRNIPYVRVKTDALSCDLRALWEPARLQHCLADVVDPACVVAWLEENPFPLGLHYMSVMECGLRVPVFVRCLKTAVLTEEQRKTLTRAIFEHAWFIRNRLSLYSSLGNHTVCECVGLVFAGAVFTESEEGRAWLGQGIDLLHQELFHQIQADGGPAEQSLSYHRFVLDLYWLAVDFLESNGLHDCAAWRPRLESGEMFLSAFMDAGGSVPAIGDSDDGHAVAPGLRPRRISPPSTSLPATPHIFSRSGYTVLRGAGESMLVLDHGPLGMAPLYNHGHADALSLTLSVQGKQMLVDPGTYRYNGVPLWRRYFKGTRSHNTITVDGLDQAIQETGFIWSAPYHASLVSCRAGEDNEVRLVAVHDGYTRLPQPVEHRRSLLWSPDGWLVVKDSFTGHGQHDYELNWHLHPDISLIEENGWWSARRGEARLAICLLTGPSLCSICGQEEPVLGWYAPAYGVKQPCTVLQSRQTGPPETVSFVTALVFTEQKPDPDMLLQAAEEL
ncbi:MAG: alginate lyase family protein [Desulfobulbus sp.]